MKSQEFIQKRSHYEKYFVKKRKTILFIKLTFRNVIITKHKGTQSTSSDVDAHMTVHVVMVPWPRLLSVFNEMETTVLFEWELTDQGNRLLWNNTINGVGIGKMHEKVSLIDKALDDVFENSFKEISDAYEIKVFSEEKKNLTKGKICNSKTPF